GRRIAVRRYEPAHETGSAGLFGFEDQPQHQAFEFEAHGPATHHKRLEHPLVPLPLDDDDTHQPDAAELVGKGGDVYPVPSAGQERLQFRLAVANGGRIELVSTLDEFRDPIEVFPVRRTEANL